MELLRIELGRANGAIGAIEPLLKVCDDGFERGEG